MHAISQSFSSQQLRWFFALVVLPSVAFAATTGSEFQTAYQFFFYASTGYL